MCLASRHGTSRNRPVAASLHASVEALVDIIVPSTGSTSQDDVEWEKEDCELQDCRRFDTRWRDTLYGELLDQSSFMMVIRDPVETVKNTHCRIHQSNQIREVEGVKPCGPVKTHQLGVRDP